MFIIIGWAVVVGSVIGGYMAMTGKHGPPWQAFNCHPRGACDR